MIKNLKFKFKNFLSKYRNEEELIKECNRQTPIHRKVSTIISSFFIILAFIIWIFAFPSSADDSITPRSVPTNLTGYTAVLPHLNEGPTTPVTFDVHGFYSEQSYSGEFYSLEFGGYFIKCMPGPAYLYGDAGSFSLSFDGGNDVANSQLISLLVASDATFELTESSSPITYSIPSGYYKLAELPSQGVPSVGGFTLNIEHLFEIPTDVYYSSGVVKQYNYFGFVLTSFDDSNNFSIDFTVQLLDIGTSVRVANLTATNGVCSSQFYGGITNLYFGEDIVTEENSFQLLSFMFVADSNFVPDVPDVPDIPTNPWSYILEMIIEALKVPLFGYFSIWDIYVTICGIFILTWLLKLLAGG